MIFACHCRNHINHHLAEKGDVRRPFLKKLHHLVGSAPTLPLQQFDEFETSAPPPGDRNLTPLGIINSLRVGSFKIAIRAPAPTFPLQQLENPATSASVEPSAITGC
ncbi:hypothetical protein EMIT0373P_10712 [Pseudomonas chlororaphis]